MATPAQSSNFLPVEGLAHEASVRGVEYHKHNKNAFCSTKTTDGTASISLDKAASNPSQVQEDESEEDEERSQTQGTQRNRRRAPPSEDDSEEEVQEEDEEMPDADADAEPNSQDQLVKKLVRYALACEYQRLPIRRNGITEKVIGKQRGNNFKQIFAAAQDQLRIKFGMEMLELPGKEKVTMKEKRGQPHVLWWSCTG
jgi:hypothetical protein